MAQDEEDEKTEDEIQAIMDGIDEDALIQARCFVQKSRALSQWARVQIDGVGSCGRWLAQQDRRKSGLVVLDEVL